MMGRVVLQGQTETKKQLYVEIERRKLAEQSLTRRLHFEELLSSLSERFVNLPADRVDHEIHDAMKKVLKFFKVDRLALLQIFPDKKHG